jgi:nucleoside 2-deoxyribosyltransferase
MNMDPQDDALTDIYSAIRSTCAAFGVQATRIDDVEHQERITDRILEMLRNSELIIADLTGERPNVYCEVGYAHAVGKRPILYRKKNTRLHFDLSVHNVPEYRNVTQLKELLHKRLEAILGRTAPADTEP